MKIPPPGRLVDIGGRHMHIDIRGTGSPVVVLESGIAASSLSWCLVQNRAAEFTTVASYDRAGFGWSDRAPHRCTAADSAQDLALLLERAELPPPFVLVGHSFGGLIARIFEQNFPAQVAGLVLVDPVSRADWRDPTEEQKRTLARGVALSERGAMLARAGVVKMALNLLMRGAHAIPKLVAKASAGEGAGVAERLTGEIRKMPPELWPVIAAHWSEERCFHAMADSLRSLPDSARQLDELRSPGAQGPPGAAPNSRGTTPFSRDSATTTCACSSGAQGPPGAAPNSRGTTPFSRDSAATTCACSSEHLPVIVLSAATAAPSALAEHEHDARLSTRGEHLVIPGSGHWIQLDAPEAVVDSIRRITAASQSPRSLYTR